MEYLKVLRFGFWYFYEIVGIDGEWLKVGYVGWFNCK